MDVVFVANGLPDPRPPRPRPLPRPGPQRLPPPPPRPQDVTGPGLQPRQDAHWFNALFFVAFTALGGICFINLFIAVISEHVNLQRGALFMSEEQKTWVEFRRQMLLLRPKVPRAPPPQGSVHKGDKAQNPVEAARLLPHSGRREGTRTAKHCPSDTHNQGPEMAMKVVRQARLELSGGSTPDLLRPSGLHLEGKGPQRRPQRR